LVTRNAVNIRIAKFEGDRRKIFGPHHKKKTMAKKEVVQQASEQDDPALKSMSKYKRGHNVDDKVVYLPSKV